MGVRSASVVCFGPFQLDLKAGELHKNGQKIRLQEQPFQVLKLLVGRSSEVVTREEIRKRLWPNDTIVEFDHSINAAIKKLRLALGDSAQESHYIETVGRRGYRFMLRVECQEARSEYQQADAEGRAQVQPPDSLIGKRVSHYRILELLGGGGMGIRNAVLVA